ncbi:MAG: extradiol ring-cleavage dioxygenase [Frankia sp.]
MAEIVLGIGTSHSPLLTIEPAIWAERARDDYRKQELVLADGRVVTYRQLEEEVAGRYADVATAEAFEKEYRQAQQALDGLARTIAEARLDALVIVGDDQEELFTRAHMPAIAVYNGAELVTLPKTELAPDLPNWYRQANKGYNMDAVHRHPSASHLADGLIEGLMEAGIDIAVASEVRDPYQAGFGHAYGFVVNRLCADDPPPILPIMLNTYFPPNVPRPARCYDIGVAIGRVLRGLPSDDRVGIVASGGLTHFAVDSDLDRSVIGALETGDAATLRALPHRALRSGNSEILNWVMAAGALTGLTVTDSEYIPVRRTPAGTGIGLAFLTWQKDGCLT